MLGGLAATRGGGYPTQVGGPAFIVDGVELGGLLGIPPCRWLELAAGTDLRAPQGAAGPAPSNPPESPVRPK